MKIKQSLSLVGLALAASLILACAPVATPTPVPTAAPTPLPSPIATLPATPPPTAVPPLASSSATATDEDGESGESDLEQVALGFLTELAQGLGPRQSGTAEERAAARFLESQLSEMGYATTVQSFDLRELAARLTTTPPGDPAGDPSSQTFEARPLAGSASGEVRGQLVSVGLARRLDLPPEGLAGKVALVERGQLTFRQKVREVGGAGAVAVVIYNNRPGNFRGALGEEGDLPAVAISREDGLALIAQIAQDELAARVVVKEERTPSQNVIAEKPGLRGKVIVLGGHYDTVANVAGAHDNGSGTAVLLTLAQRLADRSYPFTLRFIAFGSEELGLRGSQFYVNSLSEEERGQIVAMLNFDALGSGRGLQVLGDPDLTEVVVQAGSEAGIAVRRSRGMGGGGSDHLSFSRAGIPVIFFFSDDFSRLHTPQDVLEFINPQLPGNAARLALKLLEFMGAPTGDTV